MKRYLFSLIMICVVSIHVSAQSYPYQNPNLSARERAKDLCSRLTLEEKAQLMLDESPAIPRMGIKKFFWWSESLHGAGHQEVLLVERIPAWCREHGSCNGIPRTHRHGFFV